MEFEFELDTSLQNTEDFESLFKMNQDEVFGWLNAGLNTDVADVSPMELPHLDSPPPLTVLPPESWNDSLLRIKPDPDSSTATQMDTTTTRAPVKRETKKPRRNGKKDLLH